MTLDCPHCKRPIERHGGIGLDVCVYNSLPKEFKDCIDYQDDVDLYIEGPYGMVRWSPFANVEHAWPLLEWILKLHKFNSFWTTHPAGRPECLEYHVAVFTKTRGSVRTVISHESALAVIARAFLVAVAALGEKEESGAE